MAATMFGGRGILLRKFNFDYPLLYWYSSAGGKGKKAIADIAKDLLSKGSKKSVRSETVSSQQNELKTGATTLSVSPGTDINQNISKSNAEFRTKQKRSKRKGKKSEIKDQALGNALSKLKVSTKPHAGKSKKFEYTSTYDEAKKYILNKLIQSQPTQPQVKPVQKFIAVEDFKLSIREPLKSTTEKESASQSKLKSEPSFIYYVDADAKTPEEKEQVLKAGGETKTDSAVDSIEYELDPEMEAEKEEKDFELQAVEEDTASFATLLRNSKLMQIGSYKSRIVTGTVFNIVEDDMYVDFGGKFHCVCKKPAVQDLRSQKAYKLGCTVKVRINDLEMTSKFLGADRHVTILEADATLIGLKRQYNKSSERQSVVSEIDSTTDVESLLSGNELETSIEEELLHELDTTDVDLELDISTTKDL